MLPAGLIVAFVAVVVTALIDDGTVSAPTGETPEATGEPATTGPRIGQDHWHAVYEFIVCGVTQPPAPTWDGGIHTHGDGIIHMHPFSEFEEGAGARLVRWFEYGGGVLTEDEVRLPGNQPTYRNGDECPDGSTGVVQVFVNGGQLGDIARYLPNDGDSITIVFGPEREFISTR